MFPVTPASAHDEWQILAELARAEVNITELLTNEQDRARHLTASIGDCHLDLSRQSFDFATWHELCNFARVRGLPDALKAWFYGKQVNLSEERAACHQLYRHNPQASQDSFSASAWRIAEWPRSALDEFLRMQEMAAQIRSGEWTNSRGKPLTTIVNIGIGGSHMGIEAAYQALAPYHLPERRCIFIANIDPLASFQALQGLDLTSCAVVFSSKSGTTLESRANFSALLQAFATQGISAPARHLFGVSANPQALQQQGIPATQIFTIPDSIGGRYSLFSPIGFALACSVEPDALDDMRQGAAAMDAHTIQSDIENNLPVLLALASLWQHAVKGVQQHAILAYSHALRGIVQHLQQLMMESNGKCLAQNGAPAPPSGEVIWGGENTNGQHSYFQLLHQGNRPQHCDMLIFARSLVGNQAMQDDLNAMALGQAQALCYGNRQHDDARRATCGNVPLSLIVCKQLDAYTLGLLLALYENRTIAHAALLGINPFDQWGVEYGKACAGKMAKLLHGEATGTELDAGLGRVVQTIRTWRGTAA